MITMQDFMETVDYRITEGSDYYCSAFTQNPYSLSAWSGDQDGWSINIVFSTKTQEVYLAEACDYKNQRAYRRINPDYKTEFMKDKSEYRDQAWDDVNYIDLETDKDWIEKAQSMVDGVEYDTRIEVPLELDNDVLLDLAMMAHDRDMKLNDLVNEILHNELMRSA